MPKLPVVSGNDLIKVFKKIGFIIVTQKGSHLKMKNEDGRVVTIPNHKVIKRGTLKKGMVNINFLPLLLPLCIHVMLQYYLTRLN